MHTNSPHHKSPIIALELIGDQGVGKSAFIKKFGHNHFPSGHYKSTIVPEIASKEISLAGKTIELKLLELPNPLLKSDLSFQMINQALNAQYRNQAINGLLLFVDPSNRTSLDYAKAWLKDLRDGKNEQHKNLPILLVTTKSDLFTKPYDSDDSGFHSTEDYRKAPILATRPRTVSIEELQELAREYGLIGPIETSAKTGQNIDEACLLAAHHPEDRMRFKISKDCLQQLLKNCIESSDTQLQSLKPELMRINSEAESCLTLDQIKVKVRETKTCLSHLPVKKSFFSSGSNKSKYLDQINGLFQESGEMQEEAVKIALSYNKQWMTPLVQGSLQEDSPMSKLSPEVLFMIMSYIQSDPKKLSNEYNRTVVSVENIGSIKSVKAILKEGESYLNSSSVEDDQDRYNHLMKVKLNLDIWMAMNKENPQTKVAEYVKQSQAMLKKINGKVKQLENKLVKLQLTDSKPKK